MNEKITSELSGNNDTVVPAVVVGSTSPNQRPGREEMVARNGDTGVIPQKGTGYAVGPQKVKSSTEFLADSSVDADKENTL
jgi:hypothetical protein